MVQQAMVLLKRRYRLFNYIQSAPLKPSPVDSGKPAVWIHDRGRRSPHAAVVYHGSVFEGHRLNTKRIVLLLSVTVSCSGSSVGADDWPGWRGTGDGVWREQGIVAHLPAGQIPIKWKAAISSGYSGPTVAEGRVFVTDRITEPQQRERVFCFRWDTGELLWTHEYDCPYRDVSYTAGPRASVTVHDGLAYALGTMGHLHCLEAATGKVVWKKDLNAIYQIRMPIWGIAGSPVVHEDLVIILVGGADNACLVAFDRRTGKERWRSLEDRAGYSTPIVVEQAGRRILICWTADNVVGLDPASGKQLWSYPFPPKNMPLTIAAPVVAGNRLFVTGFYEGSLMLRLLADRYAVEKIWRRQGASERETEALHALMSTPIIDGEYIYGVDSHGELRCLKAADGERIWENLEIVPTARWSTAHLIRNNQNVWIFNERGELLITSMSPQGVEIKSRAQLIEPTRDQLNQRGGVTWAHPAFAYRHVFARNDRELVCASLEQ